jgi:Fur family transcriptional regulator, ferric uptake regulator
MTVTSDAVSKDILDHVTSLLHARGERMTVPRRSVLLALSARTGHVSAEQVVADVAALEPTVHRSSVYRTLEALTAAGLLQHVHLGHGATAYHLVTLPHPHAQCTNCHAVVDLPADLLDALTASARDQFGFILDPLHVALSGTCRSCAHEQHTPGH